MKLALFDIDGTLTDTVGHPVYDEYFVRIMESSLGGTRINTDWAAYPHATDSGIVRTVLETHRGAHDESHADEIQRVYERACRSVGQTIEPIPGAADALAALESHADWMIGFASGNWNAIGRIKLWAAGLDPRDHVFVGASDEESRAGIMQRAVAEGRDRSGAGLTRVVYVGDAVWDVRACRAAQLPLVGIASPPESLTALGASHAVPDYEDLEGFLRALEAAEVPT